jgi:tol-pal system protein YbgF
MLAVSCVSVTTMPARAGLFGESDEEIAAREQREKDQETAISQLTQRVHDLEESLRQQTGQNEELSFRLRELSDKVERQQKDFEYKICSLTAQQMGTDPGAMNCGAQQSSSGYSAPPMNSATMLPAPPPSAPPSAPSAAQTLAPGPGVLGTLSTNEAAAASAPVLTPPAGVDRSGYDKALNQMGKAQFDEARAGFRTFADTYPKDALAPQAIYWTGVISYTQKDYASAARAFAESIKKYPTSTRAPESMFKLGQSLIALGQKSEGCTTLGALPGKYPQASKAVLTQATAARKGARCG